MRAASQKFQEIQSHSLMSQVRILLIALLLYVTTYFTQNLSLMDYYNAITTRKLHKGYF
jgi:hypothetical protein